MQFHEEKKFGFIWFHKVFYRTFLNFLACCGTIIIFFVFFFSLQSLLVTYSGIPEKIGVLGTTRRNHSEKQRARKFKKDQAKKNSWNQILAVLNFFLVQKLIFGHAFFEIAKNGIDLFEFASFFALDLFNFLALCVFKKIKR